MKQALRLRRMYVVATIPLMLSACSSAGIADPGTASAPQTNSAADSSTPKLARPFVGLPGMPAPLDQNDAYAADGPNMVDPTIANDPAFVYVPDTNSNDVYVIDQHTMSVVNVFSGGNEPQHVVPSYDLQTLYVTASGSGPALIPIDPATGTPGAPIPVHDGYNMYFTPDGVYAIVVQEALAQLAFYDPHTWVLHDVLPLPSCGGVDHMDFTADGTKLLASCEFANKMVVVDVATHALLLEVPLGQVSNGKPQDVKLSPDGTVFYVADMNANGIYLIDAASFAVLGFQNTGLGAHGLYVSRDSKRMFVTNRDEGSITLIDLATRQIETKWVIPGGGSPDMGNISADGTVLWLSGRYNNVVYAISTVDGHVIAQIPVGSGPHGLCVWPLPGRYSLGHTGILR